MSLVSIEESSGLLYSGQRASRHKLLWKIFLHQNIVLHIDEIKAKEIATKFLEQHFSIIVANAVLKEDEWIVTARVGFLPEQIKKVRIDAETGKVKSCC